VGGSTTEGRNKDFGRIRLTIGVDLEKLAGIPGLTFRVSAVNQAGPDIANTVGTFTNPSSIAGVKTTRRHQDPL
jgi:carbohydrate-selective porin OprB